MPEQLKCRCGHEGPPEDFFFNDKNEPVCQTCIITEEAMAVAQNAAGTKHDVGKLRFDLVPVELTTLDAAIYSMGSAKYGDDNWRGGLSYRRILAALSRHLNARLLGEKIDAESKLPHLAHARWNIGALLYYDLHEAKYKKFDDVTNECEFALKIIQGLFPWETKK